MQWRTADLQVAVGVQQQVARLQVAVVDAGRVDVLQAAQQLEEQPPRVYVVVLGLALDQVREIGVEQLRDDEDVVEGLLALGYQHLGDGHDVRVAQQPQEAQLADDAHRVRFVYRGSALRSLLKKWETLAALGIVEAGLREAA